MPNLETPLGNNDASSSFLKPQGPEKEVPKPICDEIADESKAGTSKQPDEGPKPSIGLYEELLASSTGMKLF